MPWCPSPVVQKGLNFSFPWSNIFCFHDIRCTNYIEIYLEILQDIPCNWYWLIRILNLIILYIQPMAKDVLQIRFEVRFTLTHIKHVFVIIQISNVFLIYLITEGVFIRLSIYCSGILVWIFNIMRFAVEKLFYLVSLH